MNGFSAFTCAEGACNFPAKVGLLEGAQYDSIELINLLLVFYILCIWYCELKVHPNNFLVHRDDVGLPFELAVEFGQRSTGWQSKLKWNPGMEPESGTPFENWNRRRRWCLRGELLPLGLLSMMLPPWNPTLPLSFTVTNLFHEEM